MSTDLTLSDQMSYAQAVTHQPERGAGQSLLPAAYRGNPANVLIAVGLGQALGISPAQALYDIYVVNGRPSPSANLMAALARRAGHKLRIKGDATRCTATLIRADDPDEPFEATWTMEQARAAGLTGKDTWKSYPAAMLRARAVAEVVRMGASESVLGMDYSSEEMQDVEPAAPAAASVKTPGLAGLRAAVVQKAAEHVPTDDVVTPPPGEDVVDAEEVIGAETGEQITDAQRRKMFALFGEAGFTTDARTDEGRTQRLAYISQVVGHEVASSTDLTTEQASTVIEALIADAEAQS